MEDFDRLIGSLASAPVHPGLASIEGDVFARMARRRYAAATRRGMMSAGAIALLLGIASAVLPETTAGAPSMTGFAAPPPLAPSALLGAGL